MFGMPWFLLCGGFRNDSSAGVLAPGQKTLGPNEDRLLGQEHGNRLRSRGAEAARDLTAARGFEPSYYRGIRDFRLLTRGEHTGLM